MRFHLRAALPLALFLSSTALAAHDGDPKLLDKQPMHAGPGWRRAQRQNPDGSLNGSQPGVQFPANNVTLLSWLTLTDLGDSAGGNGNSCYGYTSPSGREYAIIGVNNGTSFVEITQPGNAQLVAHINGPTSLWRDVRTYSTYCYAVSEGGSGIQVMNLANIDNGVVSTLPSVNDDVTTTATHTLAVDQASGYLYRSGGGSNGLRIYSLANPAAPARVGTWSSRYSHEVSVFRFTSGPAAGKEIAYVCGGLNGGQSSTGIYVVDVTNKAAPVQLQYITYPNAAFAHQCWPSPDMQTMYLNDELDDLNQTRVFNMSNPLSLSYVGAVANPTTSVDHNLYTKGNLIYQSNYRSGLRVKSTSNPGTPTAPVEIASFDTWPEDDQTEFNGLWNNYPYFASGVVICSDIEKGLFVWWIGTPLITIAVPGGAPELISPSGQTIAVQVTESAPGVLVPGSAKMHLDTGSGFVTSNLVPSGPDYDAIFPATPCGTPMSFYFTGESTNGIIWSDPPGAPENVYTAISASGSTVVASDNFETNQGWVATVSGATSGQWQRGVPVNDPSWAYDPSSDGDGSGQCFLTQNAAGNTDVDGGSVILTSPNYDMTGGADVRYSYYLTLTVPDPADRLLVEINSNGGAGAWTTIANHLTDGGNGWRENVVAQSTLASLGVSFTSTMKVRFTASDGGTSSIVEAGVDGFESRSLICTGATAFCFGDGSSGPCPCGNAGGPGAGCDNSDFTGGAILASTGTASVSNDTLVLTSSAEKPSAFSLFLQGNQEIAPLNFGDGLRCAGGTLKRLYARNAVGGTVSAPQGADPSITSRSAALGDTISANGTRIYHVYYRDAVQSFCAAPTGSTFNVSNGLRVLWAP